MVGDRGKGSGRVGSELEGGVLLSTLAACGEEGIRLCLRPASAGATFRSLAAIGMDNLGDIRDCKLFLSVPEAYSARDPGQSWLPVWVCD